MNIIFPLISILKKILRCGFLQIDGNGASEKANERNGDINKKKLTLKYIILELFLNIH